MGSNPNNSRVRELDITNDTTVPIPHSLQEWANHSVTQVTARTFASWLGGRNSGTTSGEAGIINGMLLFAAVAFYTATAINHAAAAWRGPPQMVAALDAEPRAWVQGLRNKIGGSC